VKRDNDDGAKANPAKKLRAAKQQAQPAVVDIAADSPAPAPPRPRPAAPPEDSEDENCMRKSKRVVVSDSEDEALDKPAQPASFGPGVLRDANMNMSNIARPPLTKPAVVVPVKPAPVAVGQLPKAAAPNKAMDSDSDFDSVSDTEMVPQKTMPARAFPQVAHGGDVDLCDSD
jgi:hypothetical protein